MRTAAIALTTALFLSYQTQSHSGYYRQPALRGDTIVFTAEGDLWTVGIEGGTARRLTTHHGEETHPAISPDGKTVAYCAQYDGPTEVYALPLAGGVPRRMTYGCRRPVVASFAPDGRIMYATERFATLPDVQIVLLDVKTRAEEIVPLAQASDGAFDDAGETVFFTRHPFQGSLVKRYRGGQAQQIWKYANGAEEAVPLTADHEGASVSPMWFQGRLYFVTDLDGTMNIWSMTADGSDLTQHTFHNGWDVKTPSLSEGRIVYQLGADLYLLDIATSQTGPLSIDLPSDFDQMREKWVANPMGFLTAAHLSPDGNRVVLTARGEVFVAPRRHGRLVQATRDPAVRYRQARFMPDGESLLAISDETGELELWRIPADGLGEPVQISEGGTIFRFDTTPSPDGRYVAYQDKNMELWVYNLQENTHKRIATGNYEAFVDLRWSPDSRWLAYVHTAENLFRQIRIYNVEDQTTLHFTSDRIDSYSPAWSPDGQWMYFLSDRNLRSAVSAPWGPHQPEPLLDRKTKIYAVPLAEARRSPFEPDDELTAAEEEAEETADEESQAAEAEAAEQEAAGETEADEAKEKEVPPVEIDPENIAARTIEVPVPPGNYANLTAGEGQLFWMSSALGSRSRDLKALKIEKEKHKVVAVTGDVTDYELSLDRKTMLIRKANDMYVVDAKAAPADLKEKKIDLGGWSFPIDPRDEWRQMLIEAWRLHRDYFYDPHMHGVDWPGVLEKHLPLVERVTTRAELSDLIGQMLSEVSALHTFVYRGEMRSGPEQVNNGYLGARLSRDDNAGGYVIERVYQSEPDFPNRRGPLLKPGLNISEGDVITAVNGVSTLDVLDIGVLLRNQAGRQVRLQLTPAGGGEPYDAIVEPISLNADRNLRYGDWEYSRRLMVEDLGGGEIGYVHLRAMSGGNFSEFAEHFYPVFKRKGIIIDVRNNTGGNIDSWILNRLRREAWMWWQGRVGKPTRNMQYAPMAHFVVLCNQRTFSDGEAFLEGFRRLGLGKIIGMRTAGGGIWLTFSTVLVDRGVASAAEFGVYGPEGRWIIEGTGVTPDIEVDNLPHTTFMGEDAQLKAAIAHLQELIEKEPAEVPPPPTYPNKSVPGNAAR
ncbi:MAG: PD40 domain-containing protein [Phycisphaerales bacterium]|nr:MAG: PD40 domain-containing protein [Phycisphaerales bacterium]